MIYIEEKSLTFMSGCPQLTFLDSLCQHVSFFVLVDNNLLTKLK
jgi:hypothetical protein